MEKFYFFKNDGRCAVMSKELRDHFNIYVHRDRSWNGRQYYMIHDWNFPNDKGVYRSFLDSVDVSYVETLNDLPEGAGVYIWGYGASDEQVEELVRRKIPFIDKRCPWARIIKEEILSVQPDYQCVILIEDTHILYRHIRSLLPEGSIVVNDENYLERIAANYQGKPLHLIVYATFRKKDALQVIEGIKNVYPDERHIFSLKGLCCWSNRQGLMEEIEDAIHRGIKDIWVICSTLRNRSLISIAREIREDGGTPRFILKPEDIPDQVDENLRVGILRAPVPYQDEEMLMSLIHHKFPERI